MKIRIITVGKASAAAASEIINDYQKRLPSRWQLAWEFVPTSTKNKESEQILKRLGRAYTVLLDERGQLHTNQQLAGAFEGLQNNGTKEVCLVIGGAFGVSDAVCKRADLTWSLSPLVFPHQLVRLMLIEQLYRTADLMAGGKYHHA